MLWLTAGLAMFGAVPVAFRQHDKFQVIVIGVLLPWSHLEKHLSSARVELGVLTTKPFQRKGTYSTLLCSTASSEE